MVEKENANFKIDREDKEFLQNLVATGTYPSLSEIYRAAVSEFIAKYTDRPTLLSMDRKVKSLQASRDRQDEEMREIRRKLTELEEFMERLKKVV